MTTLKGFEKFFSRWKNLISEKIGPIMSTLGTKASRGYKSIAKYIRDNPKLSALMGAGAAATAVGLGLAKLQSRVESSSIRDADGYPNKTEFSHHRLIRDVSRSYANLDPYYIDSLSDWDARKLAIDLAVAATRCLVSVSDPSFQDTFVNTLIVQCALLRTGYSIRPPEDHQHIMSFIEEFTSNGTLNYGLEGSLLPIALAVANNPAISLDDVI